MAPTASSKERIAKWRAKKKSDPNQWKEHLEKEKLRQKAIRENQSREIKKNKALLAERRRRDRERQKVCRQRKKSTKEICEGELGSYKSPRTLGKAIRRVKSALPNSPSKKKAVLKHLVSEQFGPQTSKSLIKMKKKGPRVLSPEYKEIINNFYNSDEISRQAPGKRDVKSVKDPETGKRNLIQIRHMVMGINEAYEEFKQLHPDKYISKSKFYNLRPISVLPVSQMPHTVCVCMKHANFNFLLESISREDIFFPKKHSQLLEAVCCDLKNEKCMFNECDQCIYDTNTLLNHEVMLQTNIKYKQWKISNNRPELMEACTTLHEALIELNFQLPGFKIHTIVKKTQAEYFDSCKKSLVNTNGAVMQIDFAENFSLTQQDEIQSAHWSHSQVTIFTCCVWHDDKVYSFACVSDDLKHCKNSVWTFLKVLVKEIRDLAPKIEHLHIFSDNCAGQFKSRYTMSNVCFGQTDFGVKIDWNFFASSHGKGAVDGIGGMVKRIVWRAMKGRQAFVNTPEDFYRVALEKCKEIRVLFVPKEDINQNRKHLEVRWSNIKEISGIQSMHHFQAYNESEILISKTSKSLMLKVSILKNEDNEVEDVQPTRCRLRYEDVYSDDSNNGQSDENPSEGVEIDNHEVTLSNCKTQDANPGDFVLVKLLSEKNKEFHYLAVCQKKINDDILVTFMKKYGEDSSIFKIDEDDERLVSNKDIVQILEQPQIKSVGVRVLYQFSKNVPVKEM